MNQRAATQLEEIEAAAATWFAKHDAGLSPLQEVEFERWKSADPRHIAAFTEFELVWSEVGRPRRTGKTDEVRREIAALQRRRRHRKVGIAAASLTLVVFLGILFSRWPIEARFPSPPHAIVSVAERRTLPDGTVVELNLGAKIAVNFDATAVDPRRVTLQQGAAHFAVTKNKDRPFIVLVDGVKVRAVGTAFAIDLGSRKIEIVVTEGSIEVTPPPGSQPIAQTTPIEAGSQVVIERSTGRTLQSAVVSLAPEEVSERLGWRNPQVEFSRAPLREVVNLVNKYSQTKFIIGDPQIEKVTLSGRFRADDGEALARALERSFGIDADRSRPTEIVLRRAQ